jgi:hypothetical protein
MKKIHGTVFRWSNTTQNSSKFDLNKVKFHESLYLEVNELNGAGLDHGPHGVHQVVHQRVDAALLVEGDGSHRLLTHRALVGVPAQPQHFVHQEKINK